jgi:hypothetical protein
MTPSSTSAYRSAASLDAELNAKFEIEREHGLKTSHIYILIDPRTDEIRYVGKSIRPHQRLQNHLNEPPTNCHRSHWFEQLKREGLRPILDVIASVSGEWPWQEVERYWIARLRAAGANLVNNTDGGDGVEGLPPETREKMREVWLGRKHRPETLLKMGAASRGRKHSAESNAMRIATLRKVVHHEEWNSRVAEAVRKLTLQDVSDIITAFSKGGRTGELANRYGVHRTTISKIKMGTYFDRYRGDK